MTINEAFEQWFKSRLEHNEYDKDYVKVMNDKKPWLITGFEACAKHYDREIEKYKAIAEAQLRIIQSMKVVCEDMGTTDIFTALGRKDTAITELQAHINTLREALEENHYSNSSDKAIKLYNDAMYSTPAESLQAHDDELIEKCAKVCDDNGGHTNGIAENLAFKISALKQEVK